MKIVKEQRQQLENMEKKIKEFIVMGYIENVHVVILEKNV